MLITSLSNGVICS